MVDNIAFIADHFRARKKEDQVGGHFICDDKSERSDDNYNDKSMTMTMTMT